jgi:hypothetical protein
VKAILAEHGEPPTFEPLPGDLAPVFDAAASVGAPL